MATNKDANDPTGADGHATCQTLKQRPLNIPQAFQSVNNQTGDNAHQS